MKAGVIIPSVSQGPGAAASKTLQLLVLPMSLQLAQLTLKLKNLV